MTVTELPTELTDPELISRVREGDVNAYGTLFSRHVDSATRLARMLVGGPDADDLVSDAFVKVLNVLLGGGGPDVAFRAYLLTAVRRLHVDKIRGQQKLTTTGDMTPFDPGVEFTDTAVAGFEGGAAAKAFASLPERWQMVLWHLEVENQKPADIAPLLGMTANSVSALAYRAREGLRQAFLNMHSGDLVGERCQETHDLLGAYVRGGLSRRDAAKVDQHLEHCRPCTAVYLELADVNSSLAALLGPVLLGGAAAAYVGTGAAGTVGAGGIMLVLGRLKDVVLGNAQAVAAGATVVGVAGAAAIVIATHGPDNKPVAQDRPAVSSKTPAAVTPSTAPAKPKPTPAATKTKKRVRAVTPPATTAPAVTTPSATPQADEPGPSATSQPEQQAADPKPTPVPKPKPTPKPEPKPKPTPKPDPSTPPPPPPPPPAKDADVRVSATGNGDENRLSMRANVGGLPVGTTAVLKVSVDKGNLRLLNGVGCVPSGKGFTCVASPARTVFTFESNNNSGATITFSVGVPSGWTDPSTGNNTAVLRGPGKKA